MRLKHRAPAVLSTGQSLIYGLRDDFKTLDPVTYRELPEGPIDAPMWLPIGSTVEKYSGPWTADIRRIPYEEECRV